MSAIGAAMVEAERRVEQDLPILAKEILDWQNTGILCNGKVREIAALLSPFFIIDHLTLTEKMINLAALRKVSEA